MTELKTLKDFNERGNSPLLTKENLKAEAVKWVKEIKLEENHTPFVAIMPAPYYEEVINFLIYFFNLTSEDLK